MSKLKITGFEEINNAIFVIIEIKSVNNDTLDKFTISSNVPSNLTLEEKKQFILSFSITEAEKYVNKYKTNKEIKETFFDHPTKLKQLEDHLNNNIII